jgi:hypothetical protein
LLRLVNKARAITDMYSQVSLLVPLSIPQGKLPPSLALDTSSPWHVSALFGAALESTSLYTRLKTTDHVNCTSLGNITDLLNVFGKQTIANLQMSPVDPPKKTQNGMNEATVEVPTTGRGELYQRVNELDYEEQSDSGSQNGVTALDIDLSSLGENITPFPTPRRSRKPHLFSQFSTARGDEALKAFKKDDSNDEHQGRSRPKTHR